MSGTGGALDPYVVTFGGTVWVNGLPSASPNLCSEAVEIVALRADNTVALIPAPKRCAYVV